MNILIYGPVGSGKIKLANALALQYRAEDKVVEIYDDTLSYTDSVFDYAAKLKTAIKILESTHGKRKRHSIFVVQDPHYLEIDLNMFDHIYHCAKTDHATKTALDILRTRDNKIARGLDILGQAETRAVLQAATECPLCGKPSPDGHVHKECADREQYFADRGER